MLSPHVLDGGSSSFRKSPQDCLTSDEKAYIIGTYHKACRDGLWVGKNWRGSGPHSISASSIARDVHATHTAVRRVIDAAKLEDQAEESRGRPPKFTPEDVAHLQRLISVNLFASPEYVAALFTEERGKSISPKHVTRLAGPYTRCLTSPKPPLRLIHLTQRFLFCSWIQENPNHIVERICEADESYISFNNLSGAWVWCSKDDQTAKYASTRFQHFRKVLVWGCYSLAYGASALCILENETIDAFSYRRILRSHYLPMMKKIMAEGGIPVLKHDNAKPHIALSTQAWLNEAGVAILPNPPACSPDLCVSIEKIFGVMKNIIKSRGLITDFDTFLGLVRHSWAEATAGKMGPYYASQFFHNIRECIRNGGSNCYSESGLKRIYTSESRE